MNLRHISSTVSCLLFALQSGLAQPPSFPVLADLTSSPSTQKFGGAVARGPDVNGDGIRDLIVGSLAPGFFAPNVGSTRVFSGADLSLLRFLPVGGMGMTTLGDIDGDGTGDFITTLAGAFQIGQLWAISGATGATIYTLSGITPVFRLKILEKADRTSIFRLLAAIDLDQLTTEATETQLTMDGQIACETILKETW